MAKAQQLRATRPSRGRGRPAKSKHLFRKGMLRCGNCGEAMVPRSIRNGREHPQYHCWGRNQNGPDFCSMPELDRADLDDAVFQYFTEVALDIDATRDALAETRDRKLAEVRAALADAERQAHNADAERQAHNADAALARVRRDYQRGAIEADDWAEQRPELTSEAKAAAAEVERLQTKAEDVENRTDLKDAEAETLRHLTAIRKAIVGEVQAAEGLDAVRAALTRLFASFTVSMPQDGRATITPKRQTEVAFKFEDPTRFPDDADPADWINLTPSRVALDLGAKNQRTSSVPS